jgi:succinate dehydrogenase flavin-adding protein (antitoxin of CptAB toxin-antitoxin module)
MLRQLWVLVEASQTSTLLGLDDNNLVQWLLRQFRAERSLDHNETDVLVTYIHSKLSLIRDMAQER